MRHINTLIHLYRYDLCIHGDDAGIFRRRFCWEKRAFACKCSATSTKEQIGASSWSSKGEGVANVLRDILFRSHPGALEPTLPLCRWLGAVELGAVHTPRPETGTCKEKPRSASIGRMRRPCDFIMVFSYLPFFFFFGLLSLHFIL